MNVCLEIILVFEGFEGIFSPKGQSIPRGYIYPVLLHQCNVKNHMCNIYFQHQNLTYVVKN